MSFVYWMHAHGTDLVKVGWAKDPEARRRELQTGSGVELKIKLLVHGGQDVERALHAVMRAWRVRGEWFDARAAFLVAQVAMRFQPEACRAPARQVGVHYTPDYYDETGAAGPELALLGSPRFNWIERYAFSCGAYFAAWQRAEDEELRARLFVLFNEMTARDGLDPKLAHKRLAAIAEYRDALTGDNVPRPRVLSVPDLPVSLEREAA